MSSTQQQILATSLFSQLPVSSDNTDFVREFEQDSEVTYFIPNHYSTNHLSARVWTAKKHPQNNTCITYDTTKILCDAENVQCLIVGLTDKHRTVWVKCLAQEHTQCPSQRSKLNLLIGSSAHKPLDHHASYGKRFQNDLTCLGWVHTTRRLSQSRPRSPAQ